VYSTLPFQQNKHSDWRIDVVGEGVNVRNGYRFPIFYLPKNRYASSRILIYGDERSKLRQIDANIVADKCSN